MAKILLVEDDHAAASQMQTWLTAEEYLIEHAADGLKAWELLDMYEYDAIVLDWQLPGLSGIDILRRLRAARKMTPVLMLTAMADISQKETGFDGGADDYLTKPFDPRELSMRLKALLRRAADSVEHVLKVGGLTLEPSTRAASNNGKALQLQPKEFALLEFFMRNPDKVCSSESILNRVWSSDSEATGNTVRTYIYSLRKKLSDDNGKSPIQTVHAVGYKLESTVCSTSD